jgi:hypothetical protein
LLAYVGADMYKKLEKKMIYDEILEYIKKHPQWRLPTKDELDIEECHYVDGKLQDKLAPTNNGYISKLFKYPVHLVSSIEELELNSLYSLKNIDKKIKNHAQLVYNTEILNASQLRYIAKAFENNKLLKISKIMKKGDLFKL